MTTRRLMTKAMGQAITALLIVVAPALVLNAPAAAQSFTTREIQQDGRPRVFHAFVPASAKPGAPLVIVLHGGGGRALSLRRLGFEDLAMRNGFVVVYPKGWNNGWSDGRQGERILRRGEGVDDVAFIGAMIAQLAKDGQIDPTRVFATGASNGGFMSFRLACEGLVQAIAPQIAALADGIGEDCALERPVGLFMINGDQDPLINYRGGPVAGNARGGISWSVERTLTHWARQLTCDAGPTIATLSDRNSADRSTVETQTWSGCQGAELIHFRVRGGGHTWHGGPSLGNAQRVARAGASNQDFDAAQEIWAFFTRHDPRT